MSECLSIRVNFPSGPALLMHFVVAPRPGDLVVLRPDCKTGHTGEWEVKHFNHYPATPRQPAGIEIYVKPYIHPDD